ncbi:MAG: hypothetical protein JO090_11890 [Rhizobacter sp.]|nr:hypothetical protein [Rhizobacter sp.]
MSRCSLLAIAAVVFIAGCGEKVQTIPPAGERTSNTPVWQTKDQRFLAPGWTPGNEASWNSQMTQRAQGQNDYAPRK